MEAAAIAWPNEALEVERCLKFPSHSSLLGREDVEEEYQSSLRNILRQSTQKELLDETSSLVGDEKSG